MDYETVIGLEVHAQLLTRSKMFCACAADYQSAPPNSAVCPVCMGMPGTLPVINRRAVEHVISTGLALGCTIARHATFHRKNYPYPDLMKGYQISQYDQPIASGGCLAVETDGHEKRIGITRVHLEEDVAKLLHHSGPGGESYSLLDINRSGVPLMEVVSEPDMRTAEEARVYLVELRTILRYIGVSTANMEEGSFRCDANISLRPRGSPDLGVKVEVKNMNSFRSVYRALEYEAERQARALDSGEPIAQETRGWREGQSITVSMRSKEYAHDYRYFPEPDLPPLVIDHAWVAEIRSRLPELPEAKKTRFISDYALPAYDATALTASRTTADWFEQAVAASALQGEGLHRRAKAISNWLLGEMARLQNETGKELQQAPLQPAQLSRLQDLVDAGTLSTTLARTTFEEMFRTGAAPDAIIHERGYVQISDTEAVMSLVEAAIRDNPPAVQDYLKGKETAARFLVGQVMKASRGKANPSLVNELLQRKLTELRQP